MSQLPPKTAAQGSITYSGIIDVQQLASQRKQQNPLYPTQMDDSLLNVIEGEFLFRLKTPLGNTRKGGQGGLITSLNGFGSEIRAKTTDPDLRMVAVWNQIDIAGFARAGMNAREQMTRSAPLIPCAYSGVVQSKSNTEMPLGSIVQLRPPTVKEIESHSAANKEGAPRNKATLQASAVTPATPFEIAKQALNFLPHMATPGRRDLFVEVMGNHASTFQYMAFARNYANFAGMCGILFLKDMLDQGHVGVPLVYFKPSGDAVSNPAQMPQSVRLISRPDEEDVIKSIVTFARLPQNSALSNDEVVEALCKRTSGVLGGLNPRSYERSSKANASKKARVSRGGPVVTGTTTAEDLVARIASTMGVVEVGKRSDLLDSIPADVFEEMKDKSSQFVLKTCLDSDPITQTEGYLNKGERAQRTSHALEFGYTTSAGSRAWQGPNGRIESRDPYGALAQAQYNHAHRMIGSLYDALALRSQGFVGKVVGAGLPGKSFEVFVGTSMYG